MKGRSLRAFTSLITALALSGCGDMASIPVAAGIGPNPVLPPPDPPLLFPTVNIAPAIGWPDGGKPVAAEGLTVNAFATGLDHPRWLLVLPNGDVLVAETNAPKRPANTPGLKGWIMGKVMQRAGAAVPSADRISLLRDVDGDGIADLRSVFLDDQHSPFGMALVDGDFFVANTDALMRFPYQAGATRITEPGTKVVDLPAGPINHHWTKGLAADPNSRLLYVSVGSNSNIAERGMAVERNRAAILEIDPVLGSRRVYASGLRNPVGMDFQPATGELWTVVNERDALGSDLVPDYLTSVEEGGFYGWPYSYYGQHLDPRVEPQRPELVARAIVPDYAHGPHTASLGLVFVDHPAWPDAYQGGAFIGQHGSWNRIPLSGYKVIFVPFSRGQPAGPAQDILPGFVNAEGEARGRPVGVVIGTDGALLVADDVGNVIWRVAPIVATDSTGSVATTKARFE